MTNETNRPSDLPEWVRELLADPKFLETVRRRREELAQGKWQTWDEVKRELGL